MRGVCDRYAEENETFRRHTDRCMYVCGGGGESAIIRDGVVVVDMGDVPRYVLAYIK